MKRREYSAGAVKRSFWFTEFRQVVNLLNSGKTLNEIKALNIEENIFSAPTQARARQIFNTVSARVKSIDKSFYQLFARCNIADQKIIALVAVMQNDSLFFDFIYEVYREKLIMGIDELTDRDFSIFFNTKQLQSDKVAGWTEYTLKRLGTCYKTMLMEAGVIDRAMGNRKILKPILDKSLENCLLANRMQITLHALTGVR
jgi:hypothetical protein